MLGKLIKHEFKSTARMFAALYGVVLVITLILKGIVEVQTVFKVDHRQPGHRSPSRQQRP